VSTCPRSCRFFLSPRPTERLVNRLPVGAQLAIAFSVVIGVAIIVGINAIATYRSLNVATTAFQNGDLAVADQLRAAQVAWKDYAIMVGSGATDADAMKSAADSAKSSLEDARTHVPAGDVQSGIAAAIAQLSASIAAGSAVHVEVLKAVNDKLQDLVDSQSIVTLQHRADYDDLAARGHDLIVVTMLPLILAGLMAGVLLAHSVTGSLDRMDSLIKSIEADQRSSTIEVLGAGQFAGLTRDIIAMRVAVESRANAAAARQAALEAESSRLAREKLQQDAEAAQEQRIARQVQREQLAAEFELQVSGIISTVSEAAQTFTTTAGAMARSAATSTQRSSDASMVAEQASNSATEVAAGTSELSVKAESVRENAAQSKARASSAVKEAGLANAQIQHLLEAVRQISSITDLIAAVARQTNLLAINARIEAARAGEPGRGFSVVADEVKALARRTGEATAGIEKHIQQIDVAAGRSSESLQRLLDVIAGVDQAASEIFAVTEAQVASTRQLTERMSGISASTRSVAVDVRDAQETAHETERMSGDMVQTAAVIGEQADHLRDQVGRFVLNLRSAGSSTPPVTTRSPDFQDIEPLRAAS
jgi:methyl-accepting chemotaxis protein